MEPVHTFYVDLPVNENNIFTTNLTEKNEVEETKFTSQGNVQSLDFQLTWILEQT